MAGAPAGQEAELLLGVAVGLGGVGDEGEPGTGHSDATLTSLLALSDVMCTGRHAAVSGGVKKGDTVAVVGDGAVGLCAVIAARRLGAERIVSLSRNPARQALAREFGATDIIPERGEEAIAKIMDMTGGTGVSPVRRYIPDLLPDVLSDVINPGRVFDYATNLDGIIDAYNAINERRAIKSLLRISSPTA